MIICFRVLWILIQKVSYWIQSFKGPSHKAKVNSMRDSCNMHLKLDYLNFSVKGNVERWTLLFLFPQNVWCLVIISFPRSLHNWHCMCKIQQDRNGRDLNWRDNMKSMKVVILLHSLYWSIHTKVESKRGTAFAFIFGVNWLWRCGVTA